MKKLLSVFAITAAFTVLSPASQSQAGEYTSKVLIPWAFTIDGVSYGSFSAGGYRWGTVLDNNPAGLAMFQLANAAFIAGKEVQVGCQTCRSMTLSTYPVSGAQQFWVPESVLIVR